MAALTTDLEVTRAIVAALEAVSPTPVTVRDCVATLVKNGVQKQQALRCVGLQQGWDLDFEGRSPEVGDPKMRLEGSQVEKPPPPARTYTREELGQMRGAQLEEVLREQRERPIFAKWVADQAPSKEERKRQASWLLTLWLEHGGLTRAPATSNAMDGLVERIEKNFGTRQHFASSELAASLIEKARR